MGDSLQPNWRSSGSNECSLTSLGLAEGCGFKDSPGPTVGVQVFILTRIGVSLSISHDHEPEEE